MTLNITVCAEDKGKGEEYFVCCVVASEVLEELLFFSF